MRRRLGSLILRAAALAAASRIPVYAGDLPPTVREPRDEPEIIEEPRSPVDRNEVLKDIEKDIRRGFGKIVDAGSLISIRMDNGYKYVTRINGRLKEYTLFLATFDYDDDGDGNVDRRFLYGLGVVFPYSRTTKPTLLAYSTDVNSDNFFSDDEGRKIKTIAEYIKEVEEEMTKEGLNPKMRRDST